MNWMLGMGPGRSGGSQGDSRVLTTSGRWLATIISAFAMILLTPDLWSMTEDWAAGMISRRYSGFWAQAMFWAMKLGAYPLVFFATRMGIGLFFTSTAIGVALKLAASGQR